MGDTSLASAFPKEQERLVLLLEQYSDLGQNGMFGYAVIRQSLFESFAAAASGDVVRMVASFKDMKERQ